jgi:hypothetical protein
MYRSPNRLGHRRIRSHYRAAYRVADITADDQSRTGADLLPDVLRNALIKIRNDGANREHRARLQQPSPPCRNGLGRRRTHQYDLTRACNPHNLLVKRGGWRTRKRKDGTTEWIPPPHLDSGQARVNHYHHPEKYLLVDGNDAA